MNGQRLIFLGLLAGLMALGPLGAAGRQPGEKPIGWERVRGVGESRPIYASELGREAEEVATKVDQLARRWDKEHPTAEERKVRAEYPGAISLAQHEAETAQLRDQFKACLSQMESAFQQRQAAGPLTQEERERQALALAHCRQALAKLEAMHASASALRTATRQTYYLNALETHRRALAEAREALKSCPQVMRDTAPSEITPPPKAEVGPTTGPEH